MAALVAIDPIVGTEIGDAASSSRLPDFSPAGLAAREALVSGTLLQLGSAPRDGDAERRGRTVLAEALEAQRDRRRIGEPFRRLRNYDAPLDEIRVGFDLMPTGAADDWDAVVARMRAVPEAVAGVEATRREGLARGLPAARRQAAVVGAQALAWGGLSGDGYFTRLLAGAPQLPAALHADAQAAATAAETALAHHAEFLATEYAPSATDTDAVGRERYAVAARANTGMVIDLDATYAWGWEELRRIALDIDDTAAKIVEGGGLDAGHFDTAPHARRVECMIAPPGGAAAMYYTSPSQDWSRPGRTWYPAGDRTVFPMWEEVTTAYHEGVPGHHLQQVSAMTAEPTLTSYQRFRFNSGHGEGWALYAERLMDELGYHEQPDTRLGMLTGSAFRAARVVVDIGLHLELAIPADAPFHPGERWDFDLAREFIGDHVARGDPFVTSEVQRYLGMPGQAISYKVGEREWLDIRAEVRARQGAAFDLKSFHTHALGLGPMGLAQLRDELTQRAE